MEARHETFPTSDDLMAATPGHELVHHPRQASTQERHDLFALATSLGWSDLDTEKLKSVYATALEIDEMSAVGPTLSRAPKESSK